MKGRLISANFPPEQLIHGVDTLYRLTRPRDYCFLHRLNVNDICYLEVLLISVSVVEDLVQKLSCRISSTGGGRLGPDLTSLMSVKRSQGKTGALR